MFKYLQIETTTFCNAKCWFCPNHLIPKEHMDLDLIYSIIDSTRGMGIVYRPFGLGDPLVDVRMTDICKYIKQDSTAVVELHTNGEPLTEKLEKQLMPWVDRIRFSIDGITKETFDETRGISFARTYNNVSRFLKNNPEFDAQVRMIADVGTDAERKEYSDYWNNIKPDCVVFTTLYEHPWETQKQSIDKPCKKVVDEAFVYVDGTMYLCPWDFGKRNPIGRVNNENSVVDIWNSYQYEQYRNILKQGRRCDISLCSRCNANFENYHNEQ